MAAKHERVDRWQLLELFELERIDSMKPGRCSVADDAELPHHEGHRLTASLHRVGKRVHAVDAAQHPQDHSLCEQASERRRGETGLGRLTAREGVRGQCDEIHLASVPVEPVDPLSQPLQLWTGSATTLTVDEQRAM